MKYTVTDAGGNKMNLVLEPFDLDSDGQKRYFEIEEEINAFSAGISISPIDVLIKNVPDRRQKIRGRHAKSRR